MGNRNQLLNDSEEALREAFDGRLSCLWTSFPGIVQAVNFTEMTVTVQPAIQGRIEDENGRVRFQNLPVLIHVPLVFPSAGGFALTLPVAANDEVLVVVASRCIDAWWQSGGIQKPMEMRMHDLSDGFAIPGIKSKPNVLANISSTGAQLRNDAGDQYIELSADGKIKLSASAGIQITGDVTVTGKVTATDDVIAGTIHLKTHTHSGVTTGPSNTGPPV